MSGGAVERLAGELRALTGAEDRIAYLGPEDLAVELERRGALPAERTADPGSATIILAVRPTPQQVADLLREAPVLARIVAAGEVEGELEDLDLAGTIHRNNLELRRIALEPTA